ncbi:ABC transporter substrate-binding protein [Paenibacillus macerans]|uniref:ABC transporter substrate-binding protein n=1 Tax=Paenibacillus macerans TaxID=44252 RepID=UPI003D32148A
MNKRMASLTKPQSLIVLLLSALMVIGGCSGGKNAADTAQGNGNGDAAGNAVEINLLSSWSTDTERGSALQDLIDKYNSENTGKVKVNVDINPDWPAYQEKVKTMIAAGQTPDLFNYNFNPNDLSRQQSGALMDFAPYLDDAWKSRFKEEDLQAMTIDGQLTSVPFEKAGVLFYYNKDLFANAGIEEFPKTWDEFFQVCDQLQAQGITPISLMTADDAWHATNALTYLAAGLGGMDVFKVGNSLNTPEMAQAAEYLQKMFQYTTDDALGANYSVSSNHFILGNTAMIIDGPWLIGSLDKEMLDSIGVALGPVFADGQAKEGFMITDTYTPWSAGKQSEPAKADAIADFMKYLTSEDSSKHLTLDGRVLLSSKVDLTQEDLQSSDPVLGQFIEVSNAAPESLIQISRVLKPKAISKLPSLIEGLIFEQLTPQDFAGQLQESNQ